MKYITCLPKLLSCLLFSVFVAGCSGTVEWREEVKFRDGRVIVVNQKRRCEGGDYQASTGATCVAREAWVTINLPEFSSKPIVWHESLNPMVVNVHAGRLYVVGYPPHPLEFRAYGATNPPYFAFGWRGDRWERIAFDQIPVDIYDGNMLIESIPKNRTEYLALERKNSADENGDSRYEAHLRRIDPMFKKQQNHQTWPSDGIQAVYIEHMRQTTREAILTTESML